MRSPCQGIPFTLFCPDTSLMTTYTLIWTKRAVETFLSTGKRDLRHTVSNYPADLDSPWLNDDLDRKLQAPWLLLNSDDQVVRSHGV